MPRIYEIRRSEVPVVPTTSQKIAEAVRKTPEAVIEKQQKDIKQYFTDVIRITRPLRSSVITVGTKPTLILKPPHEWPYIVTNPELSVGITSTYTLVSGTVNANGNTQANPIGCANFLSAHFFANITAVNGSWDIIQQAKDPVSNQWVDIQTLFTITAPGAFYSTPGSLGVVTDLAIRWEGSGSFTGTISLVLKGGVQGGPTGVSRVIYLGDSLVTPETGYPLFEGQSITIFPAYDVSVYAIALTNIPIKIFTL